MQSSHERIQKNRKTQHLKIIATTYELIRKILNKHFGGAHKTLSTNEHVTQTHPISIENNNLLKMPSSKILLVNSYHHNIITKNSLGKNLIPFALSETDKTIEGFSHSKLPIIGVMWHPEREQENFDQLIINNLFNKK